MKTKIIPTILLTIVVVLTTIFFLEEKKTNYEPYVITGNVCGNIVSKVIPKDHEITVTINNPYKEPLTFGLEYKVIVLKNDEWYLTDYTKDMAIPEIAMIIESKQNGSFVIDLDPIYHLLKDDQYSIVKSYTVGNQKLHTYIEFFVEDNTIIIVNTFTNCIL